VHNARIFRGSSSRAVEFADGGCPHFVRSRLSFWLVSALLDVRVLTLPVACFLIFSHPKGLLIDASHINNPDVYHAAGVKERPTNIMTCLFQSLQGLQRALGQQSRLSPFS